MRKIVAALSMGLILTGATVYASPAAEFERGAVVLEVGGAFNSKVKGQGYMNLDADGDSGYKYSVTAGLSDKFALQYKHGDFKSVYKTVTVPSLGSLTTYAEAEPTDIQLLYKINPNLVLTTGYEHTKISYGRFVESATRSAFHIGLTGTHKIDDKTTLFATILTGKDVDFKEAGVSYKLSPRSAFTVSYAERKVKDMDLKIARVPQTSKVDYTMTGITCMFATRI
ncbi:hypothetical protein SRRS_13150 [Sporomusa rhizae]|uniref:hypothetical protein n=1 Tax=Sporomusa rhizae TaxID=357999 RepID=UPI00352AB111